MSKRSLALMGSSLGILPVAATDIYGCSGKSIIPPAAPGSGFYDGGGCNHTGSQAGCRWAVGNWSITSSAVVHYGAVPFTAGSYDEVHTGFFMSMCADVFTGNESLATIELYSPFEAETEMCANFALYPSKVGANISIGFTIESLLNCSAKDKWSTIPLPDYRWDSPQITGCPNASVVPPNFVQPQQTVFPPNDPLDPTMPIVAGLVPSGYQAAYLYGIIKETACALNFTLLEHNATANLTRWQILHGDGPSGYVTGCTTWLRLGRHVAYAMRFKGNPDMDASCGSIWDPDNRYLCCWNWTESFDGTNDGDQVKVLFDYFPDGWQPYNVTSGALSNALSLSAVLAVAVVVLSSVVSW